jgi:hypothetical protein
MSRLFGKSIQHSHVKNCPGVVSNVRSFIHIAVAYCFSFHEPTEVVVGERRDAVARSALLGFFKSDNIGRMWRGTLFLGM